LREKFFADYSITGVIGKQVDINADFRRRLVVGFEMLARYGPAWQNRFVNLYVITPEGAVLIFWPGKPWGLNANSWEVSAKLALSAPGNDVVLTIDDSQRAERGSTWSNLYFDYAVNDWMVSATEPVNLSGKYMLSVAHDILLRQLIERTVNNHLEGTYNLIFREDGRLIAHPHFMDVILAQSGNLSVQEAGDANLRRIFNLVRQRLRHSSIVENREDNEYLAVTRLQGPNWYLVTVFPKTIIAEQAFETARLILVLGAIALLLEIAILFWVLRKQVAEPLTNLIEATKRIAAGDFNMQLDEGGRDEIGQLAQSFNTMSGEINARETTLNERSAKLALLNKQLEEELEERKRAEREIARQREALHQGEKLSALGSLLAGVAHELNNPLSVVVGRALMLEEAATELRTKASVQKLRLAAERCARIVKTFLAIARQQPPQRAPVQLNTLVETAVELVGYGLRTADIEVCLELEPELPELSADADQLTQVFTNLIINAQQALLEVTLPRRLSVVTHWEREAGQVRIEFMDNGPGVAEEIRTRIFEPFYTSKPVGMGTGFGLSFSYGVIESHGGSLSLEPAAGGGAHFIIRLPLGEAVLAVETGVVAPAGEAPPQAVLIVDDEPDIAEMLGELLAPQGHRIDIAASGNEALRYLGATDYAVILSDLKMPDLDGPGLYRQLQQRYPHLLKRIVFITGDTLGMGASTFLAQTGCPLIEKPFVPSEVIQVVRQILNLVD
jgi:signal transduction histidine kinase/CheY-like chemotaxis protein